MLAVKTSIISACERLQRFALGDDVFVSYARKDAADYALALARQLTRHKLSCFCDQWGTAPGTELPTKLLRTIRRSASMVVVGSPKAARSSPVGREIEEFLKTRRTIHVISFSGAAQDSDWYRRVSGCFVTHESLDALNGPNISRHLVSRIVNAHGFVTRRKRLLRSFAVTAIGALLVIAVAVMSVTRARALRHEAEIGRGVAEARAQSALQTEKQAKAEEARARAQADRQQKIASSLELSAASAYALPIDPIEALRNAIAAARKYKSLEASIALSSALANQRTRFILKHPQSVICAHFSPDQTQIGTCSSDGIRLWNREANYRRPVFLRSKEEINDLSYSPRKGIILTSGIGGVQIWNIQTGTLLHSLEGTARPGGPAVFTANGLFVVAGRADRKIGVWDASTGKLFKILVDHPGFTQYICLSKDGTRLLTAELNYVSVWNTSDFSLAYHFDPTVNLDAPIRQAEFMPKKMGLLTLVGDQLQFRNAENGQQTLVLNGIGRVQISNDGSRMLSNRSGEISIWDMSSRRQLLTLSGHGWAYAAHFSPDSTKIISANGDHTANVWDVETGNLLYTLTGHHTGLRDAVFSDDQQRLLTLGLYDREVRIWDTECRLALHVFHEPSGPLFTVAYSSDGLNLLTMSWNGRPREWNLRTGNSIDLVPQERQILNVTYSQDRSELLTIHWGDDCRVWSLSGKLVSRLEPVPNRIRSAEFSRDGRFIIAILYDNDVAVWRTRTGKKVWSFSGSGDSIRTASLSPDGSVAITAGLNNALFWNVQTGRLIRKLVGHSAEVWDSAFSNNGAWMATSGWDNTARLWRVRGANVHKVLEGHYAGVTQVSFSPDSQKALTASLDGTARLWDVRSGKEIRTFLASREAIGHAIFSPDGQTILTYDVSEDQGPRTQFAGADHNPRVWDATSGRLLYVLFGHQGWVVDASFSPDGKRVATASRDGRIREFAINVDDLLKEAESKGFSFLNE